VTAVIEFKNPAHRPFGAGRLLPAENKGSKRQRERRAEVLAHIRSGQFANPRFLEILYDPSKTESVSAKESTFRRSHGSAHRLEGKQTEAVAKAAKLPELLLIQGPPGTGKTSVLAEVVRVLSERWAKDEELGRPFRILVAGAHNEAVRNAYERIGETSVVRLIASVDEAKKAQAVMSQKGRVVAEALSSRLSADPRWRELQGLRALAQRLALVHQRALARELVDVGQQLEALEASPEVLNPSQNFYSGKLSDSWSLGIVMYTLLFGRYPFHHNVITTMFAKISKGKFAIPTSGISLNAKILLRSLIRLKPEERLLPSEILAHNWLKDVPFTNHFCNKSDYFLHTPVFQQQAASRESEQKEASAYFVSDYERALNRQASVLVNSLKNVVGKIHSDAQSARASFINSEDDHLVPAFKI
jgi:DNA polymerase III delta prime subunit